MRASVTKTNKSVNEGNWQDWQIYGTTKYFTHSVNALNQMKHVKISMLRHVFAARSKFIEKLQLRLTSDVLGGRTGNRQPTTHRRMRCCLN